MSVLTPETTEGSFAAWRPVLRQGREAAFAAWRTLRHHGARFAARRSRREWDFG